MDTKALPVMHAVTPDSISSHLSSLQNVLAHAPVAKIGTAVELCEKVRLNGGTLYLCGNGGSASTASHAACDLAKLTHVCGNRRLRVTALVDNAAMLSAYGNDHGYANIFRDQIAGIISCSDAIIGISVSGASENVLLAMEYAHSVGAKSIGLSGTGTQRMRSAASLMIEMPGETMQATEDAHLAVLHAMSLALRARQLS